jgi:hypothetical protein
VVGGDAADVDRVDALGAQPVREGRTVLGGALESGVGGGVGAFEEDLVDRRGVQVRMEKCAPGSMW